MKIYKDKYQVFKNGVIKDLVTHKILPQYTSNQGYRTVFLRFQGNTNSYFVHEIVAECYIPNPHNYTEVLHLDKNKLNNEVENLTGAEVQPIPTEETSPTNEPTTYTANLDETFTPLNQNTPYKEFMNGQYYIYKDGRVYNTKYNYYLTPTTSTGNNQTVRLGNEETQKYSNHYVHRLMADLYMENPHNAKFLRHKDGNNKNNNLDNLEGIIPKSQSQYQQENYIRRRMEEGKSYRPFTKEGRQIQKNLKNELKQKKPIPPTPQQSNQTQSTIPLQPTTQTTLYQDIKESEQNNSTEMKTQKYKFLEKEGTAEELVEVLLYFNQLPNVEKIDK